VEDGVVAVSPSQSGWYEHAVAATECVCAKVVFANATLIAPRSLGIAMHFMSAVLPGESSGLVTWSLPKSPKSKGNLSNNVRVEQNDIFLGDPCTQTTTRASYESTGTNRSGVALAIVARESAYRKTGINTLESRNACDTFH